MTWRSWSVRRSMTWVWRSCRRTAPRRTSQSHDVPHRDQPCVQRKGTMSTRHPLLPLLLTAGCLSCGQDGPTPPENRAPLFSAVHPSGASLIVDDDGAPCSDAQFTSIQAAVDAAAPGDRILVCTGTYLE